jgi:hypothetical protein
MPDFEVVANFKPAGDQPYAIDALSAGIDEGMPYQTLAGSDWLRQDDDHGFNHRKDQDASSRPGSQ